MRLFDILKIKMPELKPDFCKIHLACWNGRDDPLDIFLEGNFPAWQNWQSNRNYERPFVVSLIKMDGESQWLFAGVYSTHGCSSVDAQQDRPWDKSTLPEFAELTGRLIVEFARPGRQSYLKAENWAERLKVNELRPRPLEVEEFPGFSRVLLPKKKLDLIVREEITSWKSALASVGGVYLITDTKSGVITSAAPMARAESGDGGRRIQRRDTDSIKSCRHS
jgi:hypothetical protein